MRFLNEDFFIVSYTTCNGKNNEISVEADTQFDAKQQVLSRKNVYSVDTIRPRTQFDNY